MHEPHPRSPAAAPASAPVHGPAHSVASDPAWLVQISRGLVDDIRADAPTRHLVEPDEPPASAPLPTTPGSPAAGTTPRAPTARAAVVPSVAAVTETIDLARRLMFPGFFEPRPLTDAALPDTVAMLTARLTAHVAEQVRIALHYVLRHPACEQTAWAASASASASSSTPAPAAAPGGGGESGGGNVPGGGGAPGVPAIDRGWGSWCERLLAAGLAEPRELSAGGASSSAQGPAASPARFDAAGSAEAIAARVAERFARRLPEIRRLLSLDVRAAYEGDPAAEHTDEVILCYPGLNAMVHHRVAHELYRAGVPLLPRIIAERSHQLTGIDIHPGARIGERFFVDHGAGTVIGETTIIGDRAKIYQGVTLGAKSFPTDHEGQLIRNTKRHPTLGHRVTVYAGAVILGGDTHVGDDCIITGGVFLTTSVPPGHTVRQKQPELVFRGVSR